MRAIARPIRHFRLVFRCQRNSYSSGLPSCRRKLIDINSGSVYKLTKDAETHRFQTGFMISRALSVEAVKVANGGLFWPSHFVFAFNLCSCI